MMQPFGAPLERLAIITPLGIRFWDAALDRPVEDGLLVTAWPPTKPGALTQASLTMSGVYAFHGLPGLRSFEYPAVDGPQLSPPSAQRFVVAVEDRLGRFVPVVFQVDLPYLGIFPTESGGSPGGRPPGFFLFASAGRPVTSGLAVVRAQLVDAAGLPAAHAVLEVDDSTGQRWFGLADARGVVALLLPYPAFPFESDGSSPRSPSEAREPPHWGLTVRARYRPASQQVPPGARRPDLASLFAQPLANILAAFDLGPTSSLPANLIFGRELVLRTGSGPTLTLSLP